MKWIAWRRGLLSTGYRPDPGHLWLVLPLLILLLAQGCSLFNQQEIHPTAAATTAFPTVVNPSVSPEPADQSAALLPQMPPIPANLTRYTIRLDIDYVVRAFKGFTRIDYTNTENVSLESLFFRLYPNLGQSYGDGRIIINPAFVNGQQAETRMSMHDSIVEVMLSTPLQPGAQVQVDFESTGTTPTDFGNGAIKTGYGIYNYSSDVLALANFYPILAVFDSGGWWLDPVYPFGDSVYSDAALYTVEVLADVGLTVASSGIGVSQQNVDGKLMHRYISGPARDFFVITSPNYQVTSQQVGGTTVNSYYLPEHSEGGAQALATAVRSLEIYSSTFGTYPYTEYDIVEAPLNKPSGVEYPGLGLIAARLYDDLAAPDFDSTVAHEVAHQWWYNIVGNDTLRDPWMDEALTTYSSIVYWEQVGGEAAKQQALAYYQDKYNQNTQKGWDAPVTEPMLYFQESDRIESYSPVVYAKGGLFYEDLRKTMGDAAFFKAMQFYYGSHWFSIATVEELLVAFQTATKVQLDDLYQTWLYSPELTIPQPTSTSTPELSQTSPFTPAAVSTETPTLEPTNTPAPKPLVFAAIGDYGGGNNDEADVADLIQSWQPEFIITLGDNNYPFGAEDHIDTAIGQFFHYFIYPYLGSYGEGADINRFFPSLGNHDLLTNDGQPYFDYFTLPGNERYYDFIWGPVHLYALDNLDSEPDGVGSSSIQADWLKDRLAASSSPWNIVYMHYPPYSSGAHGSTLWARWPYGEWGADAVLAGHDHTYERLFVDGMTYFVNGTGGFTLYDFVDILEGSQVRYNADYGAMRVEATDDHLLFQFINRNNELIDQVELRK
jgi:hypothetical protein